MMKNIEIFKRNEDYLRNENSELKRIIQAIDQDRIHYKAESEQLKREVEFLKGKEEKPLLNIDDYKSYQPNQIEGEKLDPMTNPLPNYQHEPQNIEHKLESMVIDDAGPISKPQESFKPTIQFNPPLQHSNYPSISKPQESHHQPHQFAHSPQPPPN